MIVVVGDLINDIVAVPRGGLRRDTDTTASIRQRPGGSGANTAAWLGSIGAAVDYVGAVGSADAEHHRQMFRQRGPLQQFRRVVLHHPIEHEEPEERAHATEHASL